MQYLESEPTHPLTENSKTLDGTGTEGIRRLLTHTTDPYTVQLVMDCTGSPKKHEVAIPVILDRVSAMPQLSINMEVTAKVHDTASPSKPGMQREIWKKLMPSARPK